VILLWLLIIVAVGGVVAWLVGRWSESACRWVSLAALATDLALLVYLAVAYRAAAGLPPDRQWFLHFDYPWIAPLGIRFHLTIDGLSLLLLFLAVFLGLVAVVASWTEIRERVGAFHLTVLWTVTGTMGVFMAVDLFLFYFFWELMLVPMYFLIGVWGDSSGARGAFKFFLFTQGGGLLMLIGILALYFIHGGATGVYTFDYTSLLGWAAPSALTFWLMMGFFMAFITKLPAVGVHSWAPDAYAGASTAGSVLNAGLLSKTAGYGLLRFALPLFPAQSATLAPAAMALGVAGILYGAFLAFAQSDAKRLVAYSSVSHLGFVLLGVYAGTHLAWQGVIVILLAHGLSIAGLFFTLGALEERFGTRQMDALGGHQLSTPRLGSVTLFFALASLGLPGLANFVGEFLVLVGTAAVSRSLAAVAALGFILSPIYALWLVYRIFQGPEKQNRIAPRDLRPRELATCAVMIAAIVWLGLYPQPVLRTARPFVESTAPRPAEMENVPSGAEAEDAGLPAQPVGRHVAQNSQ
jgi:NADH-quinone oxidoreductase subunit M